MADASILSRTERQPSASPRDGQSPVRVDDAANPPLRVMHIVFTFQPGGMELGVLKLVNGLVDRGICSSICSTTPAGTLKASLDPAVRIFELERRNGNDPGMVWDLYKLLRREQPHIVHTHAWGTLVEGMVAARLARVPIVIHGEHGTLQLRPYQKCIQRWAWGRADLVLSVSKMLTERMVQATGFPAMRIRTIQNGVDLSRFGVTNRLAARHAIGLPVDALVVGTAGRLVPVKDHVNFIEALAKLRAAGIHFTAVISGEGPLRNDLRTLTAARGLTDVVQFLGHRPDIENVYGALDVFALTSRSEGMSNTILEAMASGLPVVATNVGGAPELIADRDTGYLVPPQNAAMLADALMELASNPERRKRMGAAGRAKAEHDFSLPRMLRNYETLYRELTTTSLRGNAV